MKRKTVTIPITITGEAQVPAQETSSPTQRGVDAVRDLAMDPSGETCNAVLLRNYLESEVANSGELHFPPGVYYFSETVETNQRNVRLVGDGHLANMGDAPVIFFTDQALTAILWWNGSKTNSNMNGPSIEGIQFQNRSAGNAGLCSCVRLTAVANAELKIGFLNLRPRRYTEGTVSVASGGKVVTGANTHWTADMAACSWLVIAGYPYEVLSVDSETSLTLAIAYQGADQGAASYAINWGGVGVWCEPGTDFTQYGKHWELNGRCGCALFASSGSTSPKFTGTSRVKVLAGYLNGEGIADSMACYLGPFSDTFVFNVAMNSYAYSVVIANGHQHDLQHLDCENAGGPPPVTGMPQDYGSCRGVLVMADNDNDAYGNRIGGYFRQVGTAIELCGQAGRAPRRTVIGVCTYRSNKADLVLGNAAETIVLGS